MLALISNRLLLLTAFFASMASAVYLEGNGYKDFVVAFSPRIKVGDVDFEKIKEVMQTSSEQLFRATRKRFYISEVTFALPMSLSEAFCSEASSGESKMSRDVTVYVTESSAGEELDEPRAQHSRGCGETGEVIYVTASWFKGRTEDLSRQFVRQWSTYRYGVFEETPTADDSCFTRDGIVWSPAGCYNVRISTTPTWNERGLPQCEPIADFSLYPDMTSSLMFTANASNAIHFCDNSDEYMHRHLVSNLHNNLCARRSVWEVIQNSEDFKYGSNAELNFESSNISVNYKCVVEKHRQLIIAIQNSTVPQIEEMVIAVRNSLLRFLVYDAPRDSDVTVVTFSDASYTEAMRPLRFDLTRPDQVRKSLVGNIITAIKDIRPCLKCGLRKSIELSKRTGNGSSAIIFVCLASTVRSQSSWEVTRDVEEANVPIYLVVIEDVSNDVMPAELVDAVVTGGGKIYTLPSDPFALRARLSVVLASVPTSRFHMEDEVMVIHQQTYVLKGGRIDETFQSDFGLEGRMIYTVNCNRTVEFQEASSTCTDDGNLVYTDQEFGCVTNLTADKMSTKWESSFQIPLSLYDVVCSTLATVQLQPTLNSALTLRGWISETTILPGESKLIIYAELRRNNIPVINATVEAEIHLPGTYHSLPIIISLWDSGNGDPDVKKGDGIYSRYFTQFSERGMYSVYIRAKGFVTVDPKIFHSDNTNANDTKIKFSRVIAIGSFSVTRNPPTNDIYPPSRIGDLKVLAVAQEDNSVTLQWTAPGDDYDQGTAENYEVIYSSNWKDLTDAVRVVGKTQKLVPLENEKNKPETSGRIEIRSFSLSPINDSTTYSLVIAVTAIDKCNSYGEISNFIEIYLNKLDVDQTSPTIEVNSTMNNETWTETSPIEIRTQNPGTDPNIILIASVCASAFLLLIVINFIVWVVCFRKMRSEYQKCKKRSLRNKLYGMDDSLSVTRPGSTEEGVVDNVSYIQDFPLSLGDDKCMRNHLNRREINASIDGTLHQKTLTSDVAQEIKQHENECDMGEI